ncbi:type IV pilin protein [Vibrio astriarenae]
MEMIQKEMCNDRVKRHRGMTLIELLIAIVIIAVLTSIAYPSYTQHVTQSHRHSAKADMLKIQLLLEKGYTSGYSTNGVLSGGLCLVCDTDSQRYDIDVTISGSQYSISATPLAARGQNSDKCNGNHYLELTLNQVGQAEPSECW